MVTTTLTSRRKWQGNFASADYLPILSELVKYDEEIAAGIVAVEGRATSLEGGASDLKVRTEALEVSQTTGTLVVAAWGDLLAVTGGGEGEGGEVLDSDIGTHSAASGTGYDGASVNNAGRYSWNTTWSRWVRIGDTGMSGLQSQIDEIPDVITSLDQNGMNKYTGSGDVYPIYTDAENKILLGFDVATGQIVALGLLDSDAAKFEIGRYLNADLLARYLGTGPVWPLLTDAGGKVLLGFDEVSERIIGAGLTDGSSGQVGTTPDTPLSGVLLVTIAGVNHLIFYGQSLSVGAKGQAAISLSQPYSNITFAGGPRAANGDYSSSKPLVEDDLTAPDGGTNRGETPCSGAANYATTLAARDNGVVPADHVILASTAGHGGFRIDQLDKAAAWYSTLLDHVSGAFALNPDHAVHVFAWMQGENDAVSGTPYATYRAALEQLQVDVEADVKAITGQPGPVFCVTYQMSYRAASEPEMALAQLDLAQNSDKFYLSTPTYHIPHSSDGVHLTADGYKWIGAYNGRSYKKLVIDKVKPKWLNPLSATLRGDELRIRFDVPHRPMVLDVTSLALTQDHGFRVTDEGVTAAISSVSIDGDDVVITLAATPSGEVKARYALDYLGAGLTITNGASGNLRDSQPDTIEISAVDRPLYNVCPHFELTAIKLGE